MKTLKPEIHFQGIYNYLVFNTNCNIEMDRPFYVHPEDIISNHIIINN